jgi:hypothetical protein
MDTIIAKRKRCSCCNKIIYIPKGIWSLKLLSCICRECWEKKNGINYPKYLIDTQGEVEVLRFTAETQEKGMGLSCPTCNGSHEMNPIIFLNCSFRFSDKSVQQYDAGFIIPPKKYWCPMTI